MPAPKKSNTNTKNSVNNKATQASFTSSNNNVAVAEYTKQSANTNTAANTTANNNTKVAAGTTQVIANVDVGFGNSLYIRGQGAGLNWNKGQLMQYQNNAWVYNNTTKENFEYKLMLNDHQWAQGANQQAKAGQKNNTHPQF